MATVTKEAEQTFILVRRSRVLDIVKLPAKDASKFRADKYKQGIMAYEISERDLDAGIDMPTPPHKKIGETITDDDYNADVEEHDNYNEGQHFQEAILAVAGLAEETLTARQVVYLLRQAADRIVEAANA